MVSVPLVYTGHASVNTNGIPRRSDTRYLPSFIVTKDTNKKSPTEPTMLGIAQFFLFRTISIFPQQINVLTQYIDGSMVYGSDSMIEARLRAFKGGLMDTQAYNVDYGHDEILPDDPETFCLPNGTNEECWLGGDLRVNENHGNTWF